MSTFEIEAPDGDKIRVRGESVQSTANGLLAVLDREGDPIILVQPNAWVRAQRMDDEDGGGPAKILQLRTA